MSRLSRRLVMWVEFSVGLFSIASALGLGVALSTNAPHHHQSVVDVIASPGATALYAFILILSGMVILTGLITHRDGMVSFGLFVNVCTRIFQVIALWITSGFLNGAWLTPANVVVIAAVLWLGRKTRVKHRW